MKCVRARDLFSAYLENAIEQPLRVAFEQHLAECADCKAGYERFRATAMLLDEMPQVEPPSGLHAAIMARVEQARRTVAQPVRWWHIDWQSAFNVRVPVRTVAVAAAVVLVFAILVNLTPLGSITANLLWGRAGKGVPPGPTVCPPVGPLPWGAAERSQVNYQPEDAGLTIGVAANAKSDRHIIYLLSFTALPDRSVTLQAHLLSDAGPATRLAGAEIPDESTSVVPVVVTRSDDGSPALVARIEWDCDDARHTEYVFLPSRFEPVSSANAAAFAFEGGTIRDLLSAASADYGIVVFAGPDIGRRVSRVSIASATADSALERALRGTGLRARALASGVYVIEDAR